MSSEQGRDSCELAIKKTLAYRSIFKYPVSKYQLKTFLITDKEFKNKVADECIEHLLHRGYIKERNKKYYLPGINPVEWQEKKALTKKLLGKNEEILKLLGKIPWLNLVAVTGSVAAYNTQNNSDIDVMIISSRKRVWITRFFVTLILKITKKYPRTDGEKGKICPNLFIDGKELSWGSDKRNVYVAHDIVLMQPIINKNNMYLRFLNANKWVLNYFAQFPINKPEVTEAKNLLSSPIMDTIEKIFMKMQKSYMRKKQTTEITTRHLIHFNKNDNSNKILTSYEKVLANRKII